jgi:glycolate oxidase iron-sulfur subunit
MCNATCPTYQITGDELDGPRGRIYLIKQALEGEPAGRLTQIHLDRCLSCRACETTCPSGVEYHRLLDVGREAVAGRVARPWPERLARIAIRTLCARPGLLRAVLKLAGKIPWRADIGAAPITSHARRMTLLAGCVQSAAAPHFNAAARRVFDHIGVTLTEAPGAGCCGALAFHLDAPDEARAHARRNIDAWTGELEAGAEAIVVTASGCAAFIRDYPDVLAEDGAYAAKARRIADRVRDPIEILDGAGLSAAHAPANPRIAVHEPCTLQNGPGLTGRIARLLASLGYDPQPVAEAHLCCGSAGAYSLLQPAFARRLRADKLAALTAHDPADVYTANIGCWMHLREASSIPVRHWIEAVDEVLGEG